MKVHCAASSTFLFFNERPENNCFSSVLKRYQKTKAGLNSATQKVTPAFQTIGSSFKTKLGEMRWAWIIHSLGTHAVSATELSKTRNIILKKNNCHNRNSNMFKSVEGKLGSTYSTVTVTIEAEPSLFYVQHVQSALLNLLEEQNEGFEKWIWRRLVGWHRRHANKQHHAQYHKSGTVDRRKALKHEDQTNFIAYLFRIWLEHLIFIHYS